MMVIYLRRSSLSVCLSWQRLMSGAIQDTCDGITTSTPGVGHSLLLSVLGVMRRGCSQSSTLDGFVGARSWTRPRADMRGFVQTEHPVKTVRGYSADKRLSAIRDTHTATIR